MDSYTVDVVMPCYFEEDVLPSTIPLVLEYMRTLMADPAIHASTFRLILVDDGSKDRSWPIIQEAAAANAEVAGVKLSRNYGHQRALLAGLAQASADAIISMDADLQDDIRVIRDMLLAFQGGSDLALGVRSNRDSDSAFKRTTANSYYGLLAALGVPIVPNHADFRLTSQRALHALLEHQEANVFLRGLIPSIGFTVTLVPYSRQARTAGVTKYTLAKMFGLAFDGVTSFSIVPLRALMVLGALLFGLSCLLAFLYLGQRIFYPSSVTPGWASIVLPVLFLGGIQILCISVVGEYVGKIYMEVKRRPRFIVEAMTDAPSPHGDDE